jgi:hypothetical protein
MMAHETTLSSANCTDSRLRGLWLVRAVTATAGETKRVEAVPVDDRNAGTIPAREMGGRLASLAGRG